MRYVVDRLPNRAIFRTNLALYANYLGRPLAIVDLAVYVSGALTLASGFHYLVKMTRRTT